MALSLHPQSAIFLGDHAGVNNQAVEDETMTAIVSWPSGT
jgi:hypothetical protein